MIDSSSSLPSPDRRNAITTFSAEDVAALGSGAVTAVAEIDPVGDAVHAEAGIVVKGMTGVITPEFSHLPSGTSAPVEAVDSFPQTPQQ